MYVRLCLFSKIGFRNCFGSKYEYVLLLFFKIVFFSKNKKIIKIRLVFSFFLKKKILNSNNKNNFQSKNCYKNNLKKKKKLNKPKVFFSFKIIYNVFKNQVVRSPPTSQHQGFYLGIILHISLTCIIKK